MSQIDCLICHIRTNEDLSSGLGRQGYKKLVKILKEMSTLDFDFDEFTETTCKKKEDKICSDCERQLYEFDDLERKLETIQIAIDKVKNDIKDKSLQSQILRKNIKKDLPEQPEQEELEYVQASFPDVHYDYDEFILIEPTSTVPENEFEAQDNDTTTTTNDASVEEIDIKCHDLGPVQILPEARVILRPLQLPLGRMCFTIKEKKIKDYIRQEEFHMRTRRRENRRRKDFKKNNADQKKQNNNKIPPEQKVETGPIQMPSKVVNMICVLEAITKLNQENGSSFQEILKYLTNSKVYNFNVDKMDEIQVAIQNLMKNGKLEEIKSDGISVKGSFKLSSTTLMKIPTEAVLYFKQEKEKTGLNLKLLLNTCTICDAKFKNKLRYQRHMSEHLGEAPFICEECSARRKTQDSLNLHLILHGIGEVYNQCHKCPKVKYFGTKYDYDKHMKVHLKKEMESSSSENYFCELCASTFDSENLFKAHKLKKHQTYKCNYENCDKEYRANDTLAKHIRSFHENKKFTCPFCQKELSSLKTKRAHMKFIHEKKPREKNILCEICNKLFPDNYMLKKHKWTVHDKIRPFPCSFCERKFSCTSNRIRHEQLHRGDYRFSCLVCSKKFIVRRSARLHIEKTHPEISGVENKVAEFIGILNKT